MLLVKLLVMVLYPFILLLLFVAFQVMLLLPLLLSLLLPLLLPLLPPLLLPSLLSPDPLMSFGLKSNGDGILKDIKKSSFCFFKAGKIFFFDSSFGSKEFDS